MDAARTLAAGLIYTNQTVRKSIQNIKCRDISMFVSYCSAIVNAK